MDASDATDDTPSPILLACVTASILALLAAATLRSVWVIDFWWQTATGKLVLATGPPDVDVFSYTRRGTPWVELRWLFCALLDLLYRTCGPAGPILLKSAAWMATFAIVTASAVCRRTIVAACVVLPVAILTASIRFFERPELVTYLLLATFVAVIERYRRRPTAVLWSLPLLQILWANAHTVFILGPLVLGLFVVTEAWRVLRGNIPARALATPLAVLGAGLVACLVTPYGITGIRFAIGLFGQFESPALAPYIQEFRGPFAFPQWFFAVRCFVLLIALSLASTLVNLRGLDPFRSGLLLSQLALAITAIRNLPLFAIVSVPFVLANLRTSRWAMARSPRGWRADLLLVATGVTCVVLAWDMATNRFAVRQGDTGMVGLGVAPNRYPVRTTERLVEAQLPGPIFNTLIEGSYLTAQGVPVFVDPRLEIYPEAFWQRFTDLQRSPADWRRAVTDFGFRVALVDLGAGIARFLLNEPDWQLVEFDAAAALFVHRSVTSVTPRIDGSTAFTAAVARLRQELAPPRPWDSLGLFERASSPIPYWRVALFLRAANQPALAEAFMRDAVAAYPVMPGIALSTAQTLAARGAVHEAVPYLHLAVRAGDAEPARQLAARLVAARPGDAGLRRALGALAE